MATKVVVRRQMVNSNMNAVPVRLLVLVSMEMMMCTTVLFSL